MEAFPQFTIATRGSVVPLRQGPTCHGMPKFSRVEMSFTPSVCLKAFEHEDQEP
jgi:hypothetical protein